MTHVLVFDDTPDKAAIPGYESAVVKRGIASLDFARETPPAMSVLDVMMSEADGWTFCDQTRSITDPQVVFVTAWSTSEYATHARDLGEVHITKPLSTDEFAAQLQTALNRREAT